MIRIKKIKNPKDEEFLKKLRIESFGNNNKFSTNIVYLVTINNKSLVAEAIYDINTGCVELIVTNEYYRRKGVAGFIYNYIENDLSIKLKPSKYLLPPGEAFWENRLKL